MTSGKNTALAIGALVAGFLLWLWRRTPAAPASNPATTAPATSPAVDTTGWNWLQNLLGSSATPAPPAATTPTDSGGDPTLLYISGHAQNNGDQWLTTTRGCQFTFEKRFTPEVTWHVAVTFATPIDGAYVLTINPFSLGAAIENRSQTGFSLWPIRAGAEIDFVIVQ